MGEGTRTGTRRRPARGHTARRGTAAALAVLALLVAACSGARFDRGVEVVAVDGGEGSRRATTGPAEPPTTVAEEDEADPGGSGGDVGDFGDVAGPVAAAHEPGGGDDPGGEGHGAEPEGPSRPITQLFRADEDRTGITDDEIRFCAHAALTYGAAFNTGAEDLNVYWTAVNEDGGVHGRRVRTYYENDNYTPTDAVAAATACRDKYDPFMLLGGIGFDQIPAVRTWAEQNRMLYFHHTATVNGSEGKRFSYTALPTTEKAGEMFAELAATRFPGQKVGIIKRQSENWEPGIIGFKRVAERLGVPIVLERPVPQNKGSYLQDILDLRNAGAEVVWVWLNALESTTFITQAKVQGLDASFMVFPFNLTTQTLGAQALDPPLVGVAMWNAYSFGDRSGPFAAYADDLALFEEQYRRHRPGVDLSGVGGDLLFLNWSAQRAMHKLLLLCGPDCTRNRFLDLLHGFHQQLSSSSCPIDFTRPGEGNAQRGGWTLSVLEAYRAPDGNVNLRNTHTCVEGLL